MVKCQRGPLAAPPGCYRRHCQRLAEQLPAGAGQESRQCGRLDQATAEGIGDQDVAGTHGLQQARNAERRIAAQFERVAVVVIQPAEQRMYTPQAAECSEVDAIAAHRQVLSFDQGKTEIARQIGVFEVGFVVGSRRQQDDQRRFAGTRGPMGETVLKLAEERGEMLDVQVAELLGKNAADDGPVFEGIAGTRWGLRAVGNHPPAAVGRAREVGGVEMQIGITGRSDPLAGPEEVVVTEDQRRRQAAIGDQGLRTVQILQHGVEQACALRHGTGQLLPLAGREDQRQWIEFPWSVGALRVGVDVVSYTVLEDAAPHVIESVPHLLGGCRSEVGQERLPRRTHATVLGEHLVETVVFLLIARKQGLRHAGCGRGLHPRPVVSGSPQV
jgi:hypothetical protein